MTTSSTDAHESLADARHPALARYIAEHAIRFGEFTLASGRRASYYCDGKQVSFSGKGVGLIADAILEEIADVDFDAVGGMDMGATPIVSALAMRAHERGRDFPTFVVRKETKQHGTQRRIEGLLPEKPSRVILIEDVVTSGGSLMQAVEVVREAGHTVVLAIAMLDRESGGRERFDKEGIEYRPLVTVSELGLDEK